MTLNSPGGRWLWFDMPLNSPKRPPYWNSTSGFNYDRITAVDMSFCTSLQNFTKIRPPRQKIMTSCRFSGWGISAILDFRGPIMGSLKSPCTNLATDRQTNRWTRPSHEAAIAVASGGLIMSVNSSVARRVRCELFGSNCLLFDVQLADNRKIYCVRG